MFLILLKNVYIKFLETKMSTHWVLFHWGIRETGVYATWNLSPWLPLLLLLYCHLLTWSVFAAGGTCHFPEPLFFTGWVSRQHWGFWAKASDAVVIVDDVMFYLHLKLRVFSDSFPWWERLGDCQNLILGCSIGTKIIKMKILCIIH